MCGAPSTIIHLSHIVVVLRRSPAEIVLHQHRHHAVVLPKLIYYFAPIAGSRRRGRHRAERVQNSEVTCVRYLIGRIVKTYDYINRVVITLPLTVYEGTWTNTLPLVAMHHHDLACA